MSFGERVEAEVVALLRAVLALLMLPAILVYAAAAGVVWLAAGTFGPSGLAPVAVRADS